MIRRLFWLVLGAVLGVTGYRRVTGLLRSFSPRPARGAPPAAPRSRSPATRARQAVRFARDVREGMDIYLERQHRRSPNTLERQQARDWRPAAGEGRARLAPQEPSGLHAVRPSHAGPDHAEDGR